MAGWYYRTNLADLGAAMVQELDELAVELGLDVGQDWARAHLF